MSIIGCTGFEKEIAKLLVEDGMIDKLLVMRDSGSLVSDLEQMGMKPEVLFPEMIPPGLKYSKDFHVLVTIHDVNGYRSAQHMKKETYERIKFYGPVSNGVLMFYGSCEGILDDTLMDFRNSKFFLELMSVDNDRYLEKISDCMPENNDKVHSLELIEKHRNCYNRLKNIILSPKVN